MITAEQVSTGEALKVLAKRKEKLDLEIKLKQIEFEEIAADTLNLKYPYMNWSELESWLREHRPENDYKTNPTVISDDGFKLDYCKLNEQNELKIGPYDGNVHFKRGLPLRVHYSFKSYN